MPLKILVPLDRVQQALVDGLVLDYPQRCSRCGSLPAEYYENHTLRLRIAPKKSGPYHQSYQVNQRYRLRIRVCETCYRIDFTSNPEDFEKDNTPLGKLARIYSRLFTIGTVIAAIGLLLMTDLIPRSSNLGEVKGYWPYITGPSMLLILAVWFHQRVRQKKIVDALTASGIDIENRPRAEIRTPILEDGKDPLAIPLEISIHDEQWAVECAAHYNWSTERYTKSVKQGEEYNESQFR